MRKQNLILSSLIGCSLFLSGAAQSSEDVYIDLSVLSTLHNEETFTENAPLFPDVKTAPKPVVKKIIKKTKKVVPPSKVAKKTKPQNQQPLTINKPVIAEKNTKPVINTVPDLSSESAQVATQPIAKEVFVEAKKQADVIQQEKEQEKIQVPVTPKTESENKQPDTIIENQSAPIAEPQTLLVPQVEKVMPQQPQKVEAKASTAKLIKFNADETELTDEHRQQLDAIIAGFNNPAENTIAINAYNYDDGSDVFQKKRISLKRIVSIRSYLLNKGYKKYIPKVVNLTTDSEKTNSVELEEIN